MFGVDAAATNPTRVTTSLTVCLALPARANESRRYDKKKRLKLEAKRKTADQYRKTVGVSTTPIL